MMTDNSAIIPKALYTQRHSGSFPVICYFRFSFYYFVSCARRSFTCVIIWVYFSSFAFSSSIFA